MNTTQKEEKQTVSKNSWNLLKSMLLFARPYWKYMGVTVFSVVTISVLQLCAPMIVRQMISIISVNAANKASSITAAKDTQTFLFLTGKTAESVRLGVLLGLIYLGISIFQGCRTYFAHKAAWDFVSDVRIKVYKHIQELSLGFFHNRQVGLLMSRVVNDPATLEVLVAHVVPDIIVNVVLLVGIIILLFAINPILAGISLIFLPLIFFSIYQYSTIVRPLFKNSQQTLSELNAVVAEDISGIREIQAFNQQEREGLRVTDHSVRYAKVVMNALTKGAIYHPRIEFFNNLTTAVVLASGGILAFSGKIQVADLIAFMLYLGLLQGPVSAMGRLNEDFQNAMASIERFDELLSIKSDVVEDEKALTDIKIAGNVTFENVCFSYIEDTDVLRNVSFSVSPGKMVAIVGPTGAGKSTIANLMMRFYDCDSGNITIDGLDIRKFSLRTIRNSVSIVMQDIFLFNGTVAENIAYGVDLASFEEIKKAAQMSGAEEFILDMPSGYETLIGERGVKLSGGQKQRLSIARALLRNSPILILDEATAAVDMHTEKKIQAAISEVTKNRSTIVIAHRLSTIMNADEIIYLNNGTIVERGTHEKLLLDDGYYAKLWQHTSGPNKFNSDIAGGYISNSDFSKS